MNRELVKELVDFLAPFMDTPARRRGWLYPALSGSPVLNQVDWEGDARTFTINLIDTLIHHGECEPDTPALISLLDTLKAQVGLSKQREIDGLIAEIRGITQQYPVQRERPAHEAPKPVTLPTEPHKLETEMQRSNRFDRVGWAQVALGIVAIIATLACGYLALPQTTQQDLQRLVGMLPPASATPTATYTPTDEPMPEPSATLEPTVTFTATFTDAPPSDTPTNTPTNTPTTIQSNAITVERSAYAIAICAPNGGDLTPLSLRLPNNYRYDFASTFPQSSNTTSGGCWCVQLTDPEPPSPEGCTQSPPVTQDRRPGYDWQDARLELRWNGEPLGTCEAQRNEDLYSCGTYPLP
jgi:hypothetical protein